MAIRDWVDVEALPFETLLLLEDPHLHWLPRDWPGHELGIALRHHHSVLDFLLVRLRGEGGWLDALVERAPEVDAATVFAVEPIAHLRRYLKAKSAAYAGKLFVVDGLVTGIPLPDATADVTLAGHVYGDEPGVRPGGDPQR